MVKVLFKFDLHSIEIFIENRDRYELQMTGTKCRLPDMMSGTGQIFISCADIRYLIGQKFSSLILNFVNLDRFLPDICTEILDKIFV